MSLATNVEQVEPAPRGSLARHLLIGHAGIGCFVAALVMVALVTAELTGQPFNIFMVTAIGGMFAMMIVIYCCAALMIAFVRMAAVDKPQSPLRYFGKLILNAAADVNRLADGIVKITLVILFIAAFSYMKDAIPTLHPYSWDPALAAFDRLLFLGHDAWKATFALFGNPLATTVINAAYQAWFFVIFLFVLTAALGGAGTPRDRLSFLYAFFLSWTIGGVLIATVFSSVGPVYSARLGFGTEFEPQMEMLRQFAAVSPVWSLKVHELLWNGGAMSGISAFPSMHVASSVICTLFAFRISRVLGWLLLVFTTMIAVGSVHLAWHYAADGLAGAAIALAWPLARRLARVDLGWQARMLGQPGHASSASARNIL